MRRGALAFLALFLMFGAAPFAQADKLRVGTPAENNFIFLPLRIGIQNGVFAKYGLEVEATDFAGGAKVQQAIVAGALDMAVSAATDMAFIAKGAPELAVAAGGNRPSTGIIIPYDSPMKTTDDLKGKKIAVTTVGSLTEWLMRRLVQQKGWAPGDVTIIAVGGGVPNEIAVMSTGQVDGVVAAAGMGLQLEQTKRGRLLIASFDLGDDFLAEALYAGTAIIHDNPDAVKRFVKAWFENIAWMRAHKAETVAITRTFTRYDLDVGNREYDLFMPQFSADGVFHPAGLKTLRESFIEMKLLDQAPDMSKLFTSAFLPGK